VVSDAKLAQRLLYGTRRQFNDIPERAARARATIQRIRHWERGRIGKIEERIRREVTFAGKLEFTTGELVRLVYCSPVFDVNFNLRKKVIRRLRLLKRLRRPSSTGLVVAEVVVESSGGFGMSSMMTFASARRLGMRPEEGKDVAYHRSTRQWEREIIQQYQWQ
jgi:hypothetical protein